MAEEKPNRLSEWVLIAREQVPVLRRRLLDWVDNCKEEPYLIWETAAVRYGTYVIAGLVVMWGCSVATHMLSTTLPADAQALSSTGDFPVLCSDEKCAQHFIIHRPFGFNDFPVRCPKCKQLSGQSARHCMSSTCDGRWVIPIETYGGMRCPNCRELFP